MHLSRRFQDMRLCSTDCKVEGSDNNVSETGPFEELGRPKTKILREGQDKEPAVMYYFLKNVT